MRAILIKTAVAALMIFSVAPRAEATAGRRKIRHAKVYSFDQRMVVLKLNSGRKLRISRALNLPEDLREGQDVVINLTDAEIRAATVR